MVEHSLGFSFQISNNEEEYEALIMGLRLAWKFGGTALKIASDSQLAVKHVNSSYVAKGLTMAN